jgi:hypothetical protein
MRRAALAGMEERGQVLGVDLWQVPRQDLLMISINKHFYGLNLIKLNGL